MRIKKVPLYISIMEIIKEKIISGAYPVNSLLPTENELEKEFEVSKITIRNAIELLESDGYVSKQSGKGTTVISNSVFNKLSKGEPFTKVLEGKGLKLKKENITIEQLTLNVDDELYRYFNDQCTKITRMYYLDGEPYIYYTYYLPQALSIDIKEQEFSIYMELYRHSYYVKKFEDQFYVEVPALRIQEALHCEGEPLLGRRRITLDHEDRVIEVSIAHYNTRLQNYVINFNV